MFDWKPELETGISIIDEQHKKLLSIGSSLYELLDSVNYNDHYDEIIELLQELKDYTVYHFKTEEDILINEYAGFRLHKAQHDSFIDKIEEALSMDIDENQKIITNEMLVFIADWIANHILKTDKLYVDFLTSKGY